MDGHEDIVHDMLKSLGRIEAQVNVLVESNAHLERKIDAFGSRLCTVETKTAVNSTVISLATTLFVDNFKSILGVFHGA
ncbi:MAG: hypothetical protein HQL89_17095 [Magnetococcales bacterium]|nr:hypothetical protein [Magnetococcales bacterium]